MTSIYFRWSSALLISALLFSSCLNSSRERDVKLSSTNAQIYSFGMSSSVDSVNAFLSSPFTIDQLSNRIFNKNPLPFQFKTDSVMLRLTGFGDRIEAFSKIKIQLTNPDSSYVWNGKDSVAFQRLTHITTLALDEATSKTYSIQVSTHQKDPYVMNWTKIRDNYITQPIESQKTVSFGGKFISYYKSGTSIKGIFSADTDGKNWSPISVIGLPVTINISTLSSTQSNIFALDNTNKVYKTTDGSNWIPVITSYPVIAIYGELPSQKGKTLTVINDKGTLKFALTSDFTVFDPNTEIPTNFPIADFSACQINNPKVYSAKYIFVAGGLTIAKTPNNSVWLIEDNNGVIRFTSMPGLAVSLQGSTIFKYNSNLYLIASEKGKNVLTLSDNYGVNWKAVNTNQAFPTTFAYRTNASVITDNNNYIWIFGGTSGSKTQLVDIWQGKLNILAAN